MDRKRLAYMITTTFEEYSKDDGLDNEMWTFAEYTANMYGKIMEYMMDQNMSIDDAVKEAFKDAQYTYRDAMIDTKNFTME